jgi:hypothetical protein
MLTDYDLAMANKIAERQGKLPHQVLSDFNKFLAQATREDDDSDL